MVSRIGERMDMVYHTLCLPDMQTIDFVCDHLSRDVDAFVDTVDEHDLRPLVNDPFYDAFLALKHFEPEGGISEDDAMSIELDLRAALQDQIRKLYDSWTRCFFN